MLPTQNVLSVCANQSDTHSPPPQNCDRDVMNYWSDATLRFCIFNQYYSHIHTHTSMVLLRICLIIPSKTQEMTTVDMSNFCTFHDVLLLTGGEPSQIEKGTAYRHRYIRWIKSYFMLSALVATSPIRSWLNYQIFRAMGNDNKSTVNNEIFQFSIRLSLCKFCQSNKFAD